jgi:hypothetical protein
MSLRRICRANRVSQHPSITTHNEPTAQDQPEDRSKGSAGGGLQNLRSRVRGRLASSYGCLALAAITGFLIGLYVGYAASDLPIAKQPDVPSMSQCVADTLSLFGQKNPPTSETLRDAREHCYSLIQAQEILSDFAIRKLNFFQQYRGNGVLMWMVVAVTFSGVLLAGFQLRASYQLAAVNKTSLPANNGELTLKRDQLVLKSSITGLFILLISFCFFLVFVFYVYRFETPADHNNSVSPPVPTLPMGGLGPPPLEKDKP